MYKLDSQFTAGAASRLEGLSITQAQKHLPSHDRDRRDENRRGWHAMNERLALDAILEKGRE